MSGNGRRFWCAAGAAVVLAGAGAWLQARVGSSRPTAQEPADAVLVEIMAPIRGDVVRRIEVVASLEPWEEAVLYAKASGYLRTIGVDRGDRVRKGQLLAELDIPEMEDEYRRGKAEEKQAAAEVERARAELRVRELTAHRLKAIHAEEPGATTEQEMDLADGRWDEARAALASAESRLDVVRADRERLMTLRGYGRITAPFDGIVTERFVDPGALVTAGTQSKPTPVVRMVDASRLRAMVDVPENDVARLEVGRRARLRVDAHPEGEFAGGISRFSRSLDPQTRTMRAEVLVANDERLLAPGMFGRISLDLETRRSVLTLPPGCIRREKQTAYVFIAESGRTRRVNVVCGADDGVTVEIVSGLTGSEAVIAKAPAGLADGVAVTVASGAPAGTGR